jgi:hypothetical protein
MNVFQNDTFTCIESSKWIETNNLVNEKKTNNI